MKKVIVAPCILLLVVAQYAVAAGQQTLDLRRGVSDDVYMVVHAKHNPERDYQRQYYEEVWNTVQETQIIDRVLKMITSRMEEGQIEQAKGIMEELREAAKPIDLEALMDCKEMVYAQLMQMAPMPTSQHLMMFRMTPEAAASTAEGMKNLFGMAEKYTNGDLSVTEGKVGDAPVYGLMLPPQSPMQPAVAHLNDVFIFCSSKELLEKSVEMMTGGEGKSKFDDPRLATALSHLPEPEDSLVFFDGRTLFKTLRGIGQFMTQMGGGDPNVERAVKFIDMVFDDVAIIDYAVTVEYTEGNLNRSASYSKLAPNTENSTLRKMLSGGEPFESWHAWVPAGALSYSMGTGVNLHPAYERIMSVLKEDVPEAAGGLEQFEQIQQHVDVYLDRDILQAFSGEHVSVTMASPTGRPDSVLALRCSKPDRIKELIHRGIEKLQELPPVQAQQLKLVESQTLEGFEELSVLMLVAFQVKPVIGFQDGWMYVGSSAAAVQKVLDAKAGKEETIEKTDAFQKLKLEVKGPVESIGYTNTAESTRNFAKALTQIGTMAPMFMAMAGAQADDENLKPVQELLALLPDVAKIVNKFDFLEAKVTVVQAGDEPDSWMTRSVVVVRPVEAETK